MRQILLVGIGQTGSTVTELLLNKLNSDDVSVKALAIDTDEGALSKISSAQVISMTDECFLVDVVERLGEDNVKKYFPCDWENDKSLFIKNLDMRSGSNLWRTKAFLAFNSFLDKEKKVEELHFALRELVEKDNGEGAIEICVVASLAGGTGSALFVPVTLYIKNYLNSLGGKVASTSAFLTMPDVYKNMLTAEQGVKGYANAYAALRELNAINKVAFSNQESEASEAHPPINLKICVSGGEEKVLFDSNDDAFKTPDAAPFDRIRLLESIPTVISMETHVSVFTDIIASALNCGTMTTKETDTDIGSASLVKVEYPSESIVKYISKKQLYTFASQEMKNIAEKAEAYLEYKSKVARNERRVFEETVEEYRNAYLSSADSVLADHKENPESLIGRIFDNEDKHKTSVELYDSSWVSALDSVIEKSVMTDSLNEIKRMIAQHIEEENKADKKKKKTPISVIKKELEEATENVRELLKKAYSGGQKALNEGRDSFVASLTADSKDVEFSIFNDILCEDGKPLHPVYALFRLCVAHKTLESYKEGTSLVPAEPIKEYPFPQDILFIEEADVGRSKYSTFGETRFEELLAFEYGSEFVIEREEPKKKRKAKDVIVADDKNLFYEDLNCVCIRLIEGLKYYRYITVLEVLEKLIERYRNLFYLLNSIDDEILSDVNLLRINGSSSNATSVSVGASVAEKETIYQMYISKYNNDVAEMEANDVVIAGKIEKLILADPNSSDVKREDLVGVLDEIENVYREYFTSTELYKNEIEKDIFGALKSSVEGRFGDTGLTYPKIFTARYIPLRTGPYGTYDEIRAARNSVDVIVSSEIAAKTDAPEKTVTELVSAYCEYGTKVHFAPNINEKELFVYRENKGIKFSFAEALNELAGEPKGYESYLAAMKAKKSYDTPMWDPALIYSRENTGTLPFISDEMQKQYEESVAKAVIWALSNDAIFVDLDDENSNVYFIREDFERIALCIDNKPIHEGDFVSLMRWAYANTDWVEEYSEAYASYAEKCEKTTRSSGTANNYTAQMMAVERAVMERLREPMLALIYGLESQDALNTEGYAKHIASVVYKTLLSCCVERNGGLSERAALVYNGIVDRFFGNINEKKGRKDAEKYAEWFNSQGLFMHYTIYNKFCEFKFSI